MNSTETEPFLTQLRDRPYRTRAAADRNVAKEADAFAAVGLHCEIHRVDLADGTFLVAARHRPDQSCCNGSA